MGPKIDLTGERFGRLEVKSLHGKIGRHYHWNCECECGTLKKINGYSLTSGNTKSCGCLNREVTSKSNLIDLVGKRFGRLEVKSLSETIKRRLYWNCECECGTLKKIRGEDLKNGKTKSCGCLQKELLLGRLVDLTGKKFNRLTVISFYGRVKKHKYWNCECECGTLTRVEGGGLKSGNTKSCGCLHKELATSRATTHGQSKHGKTTKELRCWYNIKNRCYNLNEKAYKDYGGRGIKVCERWLDSFDNFFEDLGRCPRGMSIERIDNNGNYEPGNVRWATNKEQSNNRRSNKLINYNGETKNLAGWAAYLGINIATLSIRLKVWDNDIERAFTTPVRTLTRRN